MVYFHAKSESVKGPPIKINCPYCHGRGVEAETGDVSETTSVLFIPIRSRFTLVKCLQCKTVMSAKLPASELAGKAPEELEGLIRLRPNFVAGFFAVASIVCSPVGFGILLGAIAILLGWRSRWWIKITGAVGIVLSIIMLALLDYRVRQAGIG